MTKCVLLLSCHLFFSSFFRSLSMFNLFVKDFKVICDASVCLLKDSSKLEKLNIFNEALKDIPNCKEVTKWFLKCLIAFLKQRTDKKIAHREFVKAGLDENKANVLQKIVRKTTKKIILRINFNILIACCLTNQEFETRLKLY